jgi:hypothetical protein
MPIQIGAEISIDNLIISNSWIKLDVVRMQGQIGLKAWSGIPDQVSSPAEKKKKKKNAYIQW